MTPFFARKRFGRTRAFILATLFACSPVFITSSRIAGGPALAAFGLGSVIMLLLGVDSGEEFRNRAPWIAGMLGLTLASGASAIHGLITVGLGVLFIFMSGGHRGLLIAKLGKEQIRLGSWITIGVMFLVAGGAGFSLRGIAGLAESLGAWFSGWFTSSGIPPLTALMMLPFYEPLTFVFGVVGIILAVRLQDAFGRGAVAWFLAGFLFLLLYPSRQGADLVWVMLPVSYLTATALESVVDRISKRESWLEFVSLSGVLIVLGLLVFMNLTIYTSGSNLIAAGQLDPALRLIVILGLIFVSILVVIFFGLGWNMGVAIEASAISASLFLIALTLSATWRLNFNESAASARELWRPQSTVIGMYRLKEAVETISQANTGRKDALDVHVRGAEIPTSIAWILREFQPIQDDATESPAMYLIPEDSELSAFSGEYIGQSIKLKEYWGWSGYLPPEPVKWWISRDAPTNEERWFLMVRVDLANMGGEIPSSPDLE